MQSRIFYTDRYAIRSNPSGLGRLVTHLLLSTSKMRGVSIKYLWVRKYLGTSNASVRGARFAVCHPSLFTRRVLGSDQGIKADISEDIEKLAKTP